MRPVPSRREPASGFTLLEVVVALSILAILSALAIGGLGPMIASLQARHAAVAVLEAVARGRAQARAVGRCFAVEVVTGFGLASALPVAGIGTGTALRLSRWASPDCETTTATQPEEFIALPGYARVRFAGGSTNPLVWRPTGRLQAGATALEVLDSDGTAALFSIVAEPPGPVCVLPPGGLGSCP